MTRELLFACSWPILALQTASAGIVPSDRLLDAIARVESGVKPWAVGDGGKALGAFQIHAAAWSDVNRVREKEGRIQHRHSAAFNPAVAREYAREYLTLLNIELAKALGRYPAPSETYAAYNLGFAGFKRRGFKVDNCPVTTRKACARVDTLTKWGKE